ncbi:hypothetical protein HLH34_03790 [Gluconacetobacter azotocaptans]|uniref:Cytochrome C n=1 Tax=Gluconacetobacter azotocaptans TaxID=142834 RepID=A0A7W4JQI8_9PROT|nr:hypothetical protein [Gluconacetobacter azotocaptans]MBB2189084.1 hypothetical protein [Gluconacetobacter azotocaptans]MBM9403325.1 hypothetical protein [Gluconacetobacter azotocaptans]
MVRFPLLPVLGVLCALGLSVLPRSAPASGAMPVVPVVQGHYLVGCGGCHGVQGRSGRRVVPDLAGQVGYFLCTPQGRDYLVRLPNVAFANLSSQDLADMVNFVVFTFGRDSVPAGARPYTAVEIARLRADPLRIADLHGYRDRVVRGVIGACPQARELHDYDTAQAGREAGHDAP